MFMKDKKKMQEINERTEKELMNIKDLYENIS